MNLTDQEKIDLVVSAILKARPNYPQICIKLELTDENLKQLGKYETLRILNKLEKEQQLILHIYNSAPKYLPQGMVIGGRWVYDEKRKAKIFLSDYDDNNDPQIIIEDNSITIKLFDNFDNWLSVYQYRKTQELKDLSDKNIKGIFYLVCLLKEKFETTQTTHLEFYTQENQEDYLIFLYHKEVILDYSNEYRNTGILYEIMLDLNVQKFMEFIPKINEVYSQLPPENPATDQNKITSTVIDDNPNENKILYYISFTTANEILLNDLVVIGKPNLNSENSEMFSYVFANPNKKITKTEIEKHIEGSIGKDFHKIVENWGFTGDFRKTFFQVSNDVILFRNPITKVDFDQLGIKPLRVYKK